MPRVHVDNKDELERVRALTATRIREEAVQERARVLQESENRARERAEARRAEARRIRDEYLARRQLFDQQRVQEEHDPHMPDLIARHQQREAADQRLEAALEELAQFDGAPQRREVELARLAQHAGDMRRLGVEEQRARQERDRIAWRQREARAAQNVMQRWDEERQEEERHIQGLPEERQAELRQGWEEERRAERARRAWWGFENHGAAAPLAQRSQVVPPTDNELARMVALPVLRETAVEATECPICIEDLGEVGKTILKCGHTVCVSCFLQQMMRATAETRARDCACPVCRVNYIM